jgi:hypothetical protein
MSTSNLPPLPEYAHEFRPRWLGDEGGFSGAQLRAYAAVAVAAERERIISALPGGYSVDPQWVADMVRNGVQP